MSYEVKIGDLSQSLTELARLENEQGTLGISKNLLDIFSAIREALSALDLKSLQEFAKFQQDPVTNAESTVVISNANAQKILQSFALLNINLALLPEGDLKRQLLSEEGLVARLGKFISDSFSTDTVEASPLSAEPVVQNAQPANPTRSVERTSGLSDVQKEDLQLKEASIHLIRHKKGLEDFLILNGQDLFKLSEEEARILLQIPESRKKISQDLHYFLISTIDDLYQTAALEDSSGFLIKGRYIGTEKVNVFRLTGSLFGHGVNESGQVPILHPEGFGTRKVTFEQFSSYLPAPVAEIFGGVSNTYYTLMSETERARKLQTFANVGEIVAPEKTLEFLKGIDNFSSAKVLELYSGYSSNNEDGVLRISPESFGSPQEGFGTLVREASTMFQCAILGEPYVYTNRAGERIEVKIPLAFLSSDAASGTDPFTEMYSRVQNMLVTILNDSEGQEWSSSFFAGAEASDAELRKMRSRRDRYVQSALETAYTLLWSTGEIILADRQSKKFAVSSDAFNQYYHGRDERGIPAKTLFGYDTSKQKNVGAGLEMYLLPLPADLNRQYYFIPLSDVQTGPQALRDYFESFPNESKYKNERFWQSFGLISEEDYFTEDDEKNWDRLSRKFVIVKTPQIAGKSGGKPLLVPRTPEINRILESQNPNLYIPVLLSLRDALTRGKVNLSHRESRTPLFNPEPSLADRQLQIQFANLYQQIEHFYLKGTKPGQTDGPFDFSTVSPGAIFQVVPGFRARWRDSRLGTQVYKNFEKFFGYSPILLKFVNKWIEDPKLAQKIYGFDGVSPIIALNAPNAETNITATGLKDVIDKLLKYLSLAAGQMEEQTFARPIYEEGRLSRIDYLNKGDFAYEHIPRVFFEMFRKAVPFEVTPIWASQRATVAFDQQERALDVLRNNPTPERKKQARIDLAKAVFVLKFELLVLPCFFIFLSKFMPKYSESQIQIIFDKRLQETDPERYEEKVKEIIVDLLQAEDPFPSTVSGNVKDKVPLPHELIVMQRQFSELYSNMVSSLVAQVESIDPDFNRQENQAQELAGNNLPAAQRNIDERQVRIKRLLRDLLPSLPRGQGSFDTVQLTMENVSNIVHYLFNYLDITDGPVWRTYITELLIIASSTGGLKPGLDVGKKIAERRLYSASGVNLTAFADGAGE